MWTTRPVCFKMWSSVARHSFEKSSKPWKLNEQEANHAAKIAFWESEVVDIPECTPINRGEEVELDVDPAVVAVLVLSDLSSNESDSHLGLRSNNRTRRTRAHHPSEQHT